MEDCQYLQWQYLLGVKLGGDTYYFGKLKKKPYFGDGRLEIKKEDILQALSFTYKMDTLMVVLLIYYLRHLSRDYLSYLLVFLALFFSL